MTKKILVADDEKRMRILISDFLRNAGYSIIEAYDGAQAIEQFREMPDISLVILDVMMPYYNGWEVCKEIRKISTIPIIMLTAKVAESDELHGFHTGADEYIKKPFSPSILVARVNALLRRSYSADNIIKKGTLTIDMDRHTVKCIDAEIELSSTEYKLLTYLIQNEGVVLSREKILNSIWGYDYKGTDRTVDTHINRLRDKLENASSYIQTVRGYGYKFKVSK